MIRQGNIRVSAVGSGSIEPLGDNVRATRSTLPKWCRADRTDFTERPTRERAKGHRTLADNARLEAARAKGDTGSVPSINPSHRGPMGDARPRDRGGTAANVFALA
jgi:hypothetical protein